jgi:hypothetical protein
MDGVDSYKSLLCYLKLLLSEDMLEQFTGNMLSTWILAKPQIIQHMLVNGWLFFTDLCASTRQDDEMYDLLLLIQQTQSISRMISHLFDPSFSETDDDALESGSKPESYHGDGDILSSKISKFAREVLGGGTITENTGVCFTSIRDTIPAPILRRKKSQSPEACSNATVKIHLIPALTTIGYLNQAIGPITTSPPFSHSLASISRIPHGCWRTAPMTCAVVQLFSDFVHYYPIKDKQVDDGLGQYIYSSCVRLERQHLTHRTSSKMLEAFVYVVFIQRVRLYQETRDQAKEHRWDTKSQMSYLSDNIDINPENHVLNETVGAPWIRKLDDSLAISRPNTSTKIFAAMREWSKLLVYNLAQIMNGKRGPEIVDLVAHTVVMVGKIIARNNGVCADVHPILASLKKTSLSPRFAQADASSRASEVANWLCQAWLTLATENTFLRATLIPKDPTNQRASKIEYFPTLDHDPALSFLLLTYLFEEIVNFVPNT